MPASCVVCESDKRFKHTGASIGPNANANVNAASGSIHLPTGANTIELPKDFEVPSQIASKRHPPHSHSHTVYMESFCLSQAERLPGILFLSIIADF